MKKNATPKSKLTIKKVLVSNLTSVKVNHTKETTETFTLSNF